MLVVLGLVATDRLHYLQGVTTEHITAAMMAGGVIIFVVKFISWQREKKTGQSPES